ncbi:MAG: hypothetical protein ACKO7W_16685 [Elainella sp.]
MGQPEKPTSKRYNPITLRRSDGLQRPPTASDAHCVWCLPRLMARPVIFVVPHHEFKSGSV